MKNIDYLVILALFLANMVLQAACGSKSMQGTDMKAKLDAPLRMKLNEIEQSENPESLKCFLKINGPLDEKGKKMLEELGIQITSVIENIITFEGRPDAIYQVAALDFVLSISLSQTHYP